MSGQEQRVRVEQKLDKLGLELPPASTSRPDFPIPFTRLRVSGRRIFVSGQGPRDAAGTYEGPWGKVPTEVTLEQGQAAARKVLLAMLGDLWRELGDLDRVTAWMMVSGFVNAEPGYEQTTLVMNGFSDLLLELFEPEVAQHARSSIGVAALPNNVPVIVAAELEFE